MKNNLFIPMYIDKVKLFDLDYEVDGVKKSGTYSFVFVTNTSRMGGISNIYNDIIYVC